MDKRIKVLTIPSDTQGVGHFRNIWPAQILHKKYSDKVKIDINPQVNFKNIDYLSEYDIIHFHRQLGPYNEFIKLVTELKKRGVIIVMDIDDYWDIPVTHPLYEQIVKEKLAEKVESNLRYSDYITTTTTTFKKVIDKFNVNTFIVPNALNMNHKMWKSDPVKNTSDKCRIAWIGGSSHYHDLKPVEYSFKKLIKNEELKDKFQFILCGFDTRGNVSEQMPDGSVNNRSIKPHETIWVQFEKIFTDDFNLIEGNDEYKEWLSKFKKGNFEGEYDKNYVRRWTLPLTKYGYHYNYCDVCLAPLESIETYKEIKDTEGTLHRVRPDYEAKGTIKTRPHIFNEVKSELKIIEAGMTGKVLIAQDFGIYKDLIVDGVNGLLVDETDKKSWYKAIKRVINDAELREKLSKNLNEFVKEKYDIENVAKLRLEIYQKLMQDKEDGTLNSLRKEQTKLINQFNLENDLPDENEFKTIPNNFQYKKLLDKKTIDKIAKDVFTKTSQKTKNRPY